MNGYMSEKYRRENTFQKRQNDTQSASVRGRIEIWGSSNT